MRGLLIACVLFVGAADAAALRIVGPRLAGQNLVRWWEFDWRSVEFRPVADAAPVRLLFYEDERRIAESAKAVIESTWREYAERFDYRPTRVSPLLLYNSHFEFESTNAFFVSEGLLGVTSTEDLTLSLPYWGENRRFVEVLRHEAAHVFTIQLVDDAARAKGVLSPLGAAPLWFIEGLAQEAALGEVTPEVVSVLVEGVASERAAKKGDKPKVRVPGLFDEGPGTFERVYLVGHAQVRFLVDEFGLDAPRRILRALPTPSADGLIDFPVVVAKTTGVPAAELETRWRAWVERVVAPHLAASQESERIPTAGGRFDTFVVSNDGLTLFYRAYDTTTGRSSLWLQDTRDPEDRVRVDEDDRLGLESLHPIDRNVMAIGPGVIAWIGRRGPTDRIFVARWSREGKLRVERPVVHRINGEDDVIEAGSPAFAPDVSSIAFVGLSRTRGVLDVYRIDRPLEPGAPPVQLTDDAYAERDLAWSDYGLVLSSDATADGRWEVFRLEDGRKVRMTAFEGESDATAPRWAGRDVVCTATASGVAQAYRLAESGAVERLTQVPAGLAGGAFLASGALVGMRGEGDERTLVAIRPEGLLARAVAMGPTDAASWSPPVSVLGPEKPYSAVRNLRLADVAAFAAPGPFVAGRAVFTDRLRNQVFGLQLAILDDFDRSSAALTWIDRTGRWDRGLTALVDTGVQLVPPAPSSVNTYLLQRIGVAGSLTYPFGRFLRLEVYASPQALRAFDFTFPRSAFAQHNEGTFAALQAGVRLGIDTLRLHPSDGPVAGTSVLLGAGATGVLKAGASWATFTAEFAHFQTITRRFPRLHLYGRIAGGLQPGGDLAEQFYLPPEYNLRAWRPSDVGAFGKDYAFGTLELRVPLLPGRPGWPGLQAIVGGDIGSIAFALRELPDSLVADFAVGFNVLFGPLALRFHFVRPFDLSEAGVNEAWQTLFSLATPLVL